MKKIAELLKGVRSYSIGLIEKWLRRRFVRLHGEGEPHQADVYRCITCGNLITWKKIRSADVCCQGRMFPAEPTWWEAFRLVVLP